MPKAFLIKKKHEAMLAAQLTGVKRPWLDEMELPEDLSRSSVSPTLSVSPAPSDCSATVPDVTSMPFDLSTKRSRVESPELITPLPMLGHTEWPRLVMPLPYPIPPFYYPLLPTFSPQIVSSNASSTCSSRPSAQPSGVRPPMVQIPQDVAVVPSWVATEDKDLNAHLASAAQAPSSPVSPSSEGKGGSFSCRFCSKSYVSMGALKMHIRTHTLPCKCDICGKAFSRPWLLQGHIRTHTGEKPFECEHCHRAFADRSNLRAHLQTHQEVKKYSCTRCSKTFSRMSLLQKHQDSGACCQSTTMPRPSPQSSPAAAVPAL